MLLETLASFYCIVRTESKLTYRNNQVGYACNYIKAHWQLLKRAGSYRPRGELNAPHSIVQKF